MKRLIFLFLLTTAPALANAPVGMRWPIPRRKLAPLALGQELRCVICQSESINDFQADMARDMRLLAFAKTRYGVLFC